MQVDLVTVRLSVPEPGPVVITACHKSWSYWRVVDTPNSSIMACKKIKVLILILNVLEFNGPVNTIKAWCSWSAYLTTLFPGRLSSLSN